VDAGIVGKKVTRAATTGWWVGTPKGIGRLPGLNQKLNFNRELSSRPLSTLASNTSCSGVKRLAGNYIKHSYSNNCPLGKMVLI
jgi:hypothetical protein